jgi:hypothetical protein
VREEGSAPFAASRANGSSFGASEHASCAFRTTWATGSAGTKRSSGERRGEGAGGTKGRGRCAKGEARRSLLRERAALPLGRPHATTAPPALLKRGTRQLQASFQLVEHEQRGVPRDHRLRHTRGLEGAACGRSGLLRSGVVGERPPEPPPAAGEVAHAPSRGRSA